MKSGSKIAALYISLISAVCFAGCDITPKSPVLAGDTGGSSNEQVGTIQPDPPPQHAGKKPLKPQAGQDSEKGPE